MLEAPGKTRKLEFHRERATHSGAAGDTTFLHCKATTLKAFFSASLGLRITAENR